MKKRDMLGERFGRLVVMEETPPKKFTSGTTRRMFKCLCDCGRTKICDYLHLVNGDTTSCGCYRIEKRKNYTQNLIGQRFGKLTVVEYIGTKQIGTNQSSPLWKCQCDCDRITNVTSRDLKSGNTKSCGCLLKEISINKRVGNTYVLDGSYGIGFCSNTNSEFYFDLDDFDIIKKYTWYENDSGYALTQNDDKKIRMHRLVIGENCAQYDHINRNRLDNRKSNLRPCTQSENNMNRITYSNTGRHRGVYKTKNRDKWVASIGFKNKSIHLGTYDN